MEEIERKLRSHPFITPKILQNTHIQTLFGNYVPYFTKSIGKSERRLIDLPDGSQLAAECWFQKDKKKHATVVVLSGLDGFRGSEDPRFAQNIVMKAHFFGYNAIHLKQRGEGDIIHLTKSLFNNYLGNDMQCALKQLAQWGLTEVYLVGLSAGGYLSLLEIGRLGNKVTKNIRGIVAVSAPLDGLRTWNHIEANKFYDRLLLQAYKNLIKRRM